MKSTGMVRRMDDLGRIVLPAEIRQNMGLEPKDALEIFTDEGRIVLQKYQPACIFCNSADNVHLYAGKKICDACIQSLKQQF